MFILYVYLFNFFYNEYTKNNNWNKNKNLYE